LGAQRGVQHRHGLLYRERQVDERDMYDGIRRITDGDTPVRPVPNVGASAYTYYNTEIGTYVVTYDSNLYLSVAWVSGLDQPRTTDPELSDLLAQVCRQTMANLVA
jgi:hypothetical protein